MLRNVSVLFLFLAVKVSFAQQLEKDSRKAASIHNCLNNISEDFKDSATVIVVNKTVMGALKDIKKDLTTLFASEIIDSIEFIKATKRFNDPFNKIEKNVIRFILTRNTILINKDLDSAKLFVHTVAVNESWKKHLVRWIDNFVPGSNGAPLGTYTAIVQFKLDTSGKICDIIPLTNEGYGTEEQIIRAILRYPKQEPYFVNGKAVIAYRKQPVTFVVDMNSKAFSNGGSFDPEFPPFKLSTYKIRAGLENLIEIEVDGVPDKDIEVELSSGTIIRMSIGRYRARVDEKGKVNLIVWKYKKKKKELVGQTELDVQ